MHEEEGVHLPEAEVVRLDEIADPQAVGMVLQERRPGLAAAPASRSAQVFLDRALADPEAELEQFAANALRPPTGGCAGPYRG
jgi:hypothetical protein